MQVIRSRYQLTTGALVARLIFTMSFQGSFAFSALINYSVHSWFWCIFFTVLAILWTEILRRRLTYWKNY